MTDENPRTPDRKLAFVGPAVIAAIVVAIIAVAWLMQSQGSGRKGQALPSGDERAPAAPASAATEPATPVIQPPLSRAELINGANEAAAAYAMGEAPKGSDPFLGRQFALRLPFGCGGPLAFGSSAQAFAEYDAEKRTIRLVARPSDLTQLPLLQASPRAENLEHAEGFWIPRPWTYSEACPPKRDIPGPAAPSPPSSPTLGIVQLFDTGASRLMRRDGRAYEFARKAPEDDPSLLSHSYRLVVEGRLVDFGNGRTLRCWNESADHRPICLYAVQLARIAFEDGETGRLLAEWRE